MSETLRDSATSNGTEAAARVIDVLLLFTDGPSTLGVTHIARELGLSKAVVHRILQSLVSRSALLFDPASRAYRLGPAVVALGARSLRDSDLRRAALPVVRRLHEATDETTTLSELVGTERVYIDQMESTREIRMTVEIGRRFPLHAGASSKAILAELPEPELEAVLAAPLGRLTPETVVDPDRIRAELAAIRARGAAVSGGERQGGASSIASAVRWADGRVVGAISVCGPIMRFDEATCERYVPLVRDAAVDVSRALGWNGG
ncbi:DNA-binding IclR family transcriptional regulator [Spinactinospora alkalitolerans]|uniref:DNA-binding IclR family transcriptional regulator n=1 Tax=Spinactinospora alkalitolerans TaxID=687207 RepID=A0A852TQY9_9ACTN|nr:IclR family transcriptional regulator [Spinactinospora alkalitolerans]NYE45971.1 DNA-binding IclR family transcriptional regulator [Spinactinospora alkalitolerans]